MNIQHDHPAQAAHPELPEAEPMSLRERLLHEASQRHDALEAEAEAHAVAAVAHQHSYAKAREWGDLPAADRAHAARLDALECARHARLSLSAARAELENVRMGRHPLLEAQRLEGTARMNAATSAEVEALQARMDAVFTAEVKDVAHRLEQLLRSQLRTVPPLVAALAAGADAAQYRG